MRVIKEEVAWKDDEESKNGTMEREATHEGDVQGAVRGIIDKQVRSNDETNNRVDMETY